VLGLDDVTDAELEPLVSQAVQTYVNSLGIGENIKIAEIISRVLAVPGVADVRMVDPTANVTVPAGQLARVDDDNVVVV
jgi:uncharacterized phage protein gp47/JayE